MNRRLIGVFSFALALATVTSFLAYRLLLSRMHAPAARPAALPANRLLVAAHDLQVGALIADADLKEIPWPGSMPEHAVRSRQELAGRGVIANIYENEPILEV